MGPRQLSYQCEVCRWQGQLEPVDAGNAAPCPQCGVYLYPRSWAQTWGLVLLIVGACLGLIFAVAYLR